MWVDESAFERAAVEARTIQEQTGFLPALDDPRLKAREILSWFPLEGDGPIDGLLRLHRPEDYATRAVVAATLYSLIGDNPSGDAYDTLASALQRLVACVAAKDLADPALLRWELHLAATANLLERALEVWRRFEDVEPTPEVRALVANTVFLLVHPSMKRANTVPIALSMTGPFQEVAHGLLIGPGTRRICTLVSQSLCG